MIEARDNIPAAARVCATSPSVRDSISGGFF